MHQHKCGKDTPGKANHQSRDSRAAKNQKAEHDQHQEHSKSGVGDAAVPAGPELECSIPLVEPAFVDRSDVFCERRLLTVGSRGDWLWHCERPASMDKIERSTLADRR